MVEITDEFECFDLEEAVRKKDINFVQNHLETSNIGISSSVCNKLINMAFNIRHRAMVKLLLKHGADPNPILSRAVIQKQYPYIQELIDHGANVNQNEEGMFSIRYYVPTVIRRKIPLICHAILNKHEETALLLLKNGVNMNAADSEGGSVLIYALHYKMRRLARKLISMGCNINARDNEGYTAVHVAAMSYIPDVLAILLKRNVDTSHPEGETLLHLAVKSYNDDFRPNVNHTDDVSGFFRKLLAHRRCDINVQNSSGYTPFHEAILKLVVIGSSDTSRIISLLLSADPDLSIKDKNGATPIQHMVQLSNLYMASEYVTDILLHNFKPILWYVVYRDLKDKMCISDNYRKCIYSHPLLKLVIYCFEFQADKMRMIKFKGISIADLFSLDIDKIVVLSNDPEFEEAFKKVDMFGLFPSFADQVMGIWSKARAKRDYRKMLISQFHRYLPVEVILKVVDYVI